MKIYMYTFLNWGFRFERIQFHIHTLDNSYTEERIRFLGIYIWSYRTKLPKAATGINWDGYIELDIFCRRIVINLTILPKWSKVGGKSET
jgi:hypothetical protein